MNAEEATNILIARTPEEWAAINYPKKSAGHIFFDGGYEYFQYGNSVYKADRKDPVETVEKIRGCARFFCTIAAWPGMRIAKTHAHAIAGRV